MFRLIDPEAVHEYRHRGAVFRYREAPCDEVARLKEQHADELGRLDVVSFRHALLCAYLVGWDDVGDRDGVEVEFSQDVVSETVSRFPEDLAQRLDLRILALYREGVDSGKDSATGSSG